MIYDDDNAVARVSQSGPSHPVAVDEIGILGLTTGGGADRISQGYLHAVHPETGVAVVFVPGEALPGWALEIQNARMRPSNARDKQDATHSGKPAVRASQSKQVPK